jgi:hypothetical protein
MFIGKGVCMYIHFVIFLTIAAITSLSTSIIAKEIAIYRWVDENNEIHFSQNQPSNDTYSKLTTFSSYKTKKKSDNNKIKNEPSINEQLSEYEKQQAEIVEKNKVIAGKNCKAAQLNIKMLNTLDKVTIRDSTGKNHVLTKEERKVQTALSNKHIDVYCNNSVSNSNYSFIK